MRLPVLIFVLCFTLTEVNSQVRHWTHPDFIQLQYAGSIGYFSAGAGYNIFRDRARASLSYGHVPESKGGTLNIFAGKLMFIPKQYSLSQNTTISPYDLGLMVSYHAGSDFRSRWPGHRYPENYYWWQTSFRFHLNFQPSATFKVRDHTVFKAVTTYLDINTNELYMVSFFQNLNTIRFYQIFKLGAGVRMHF